MEQEIIRAQKARESTTAYLVAAIMNDVANSIRRHENRSSTAMKVTDFREEALVEIRKRLEQDGYKTELEYSQNKDYMYLILWW